MPDDWPDDDALLQYVKESQEHKRAWAIVAGLSKRLLQERGANSLLKKAGGIAAPAHTHRRNAPLTGPKPEDWSDRIQTLERRIAKQKAALTKLEECRAFEAETERILVSTLEHIRDHASANTSGHYAGLIAQETLFEYATRIGPRPKEVSRS